MDIGSAKVDELSMAEVPHHLINVTDINEQFSAGDYFRLAKLSLEVCVHVYREEEGGGEGGIILITKY